jgi:hypothetical protein
MGTDAPAIARGITGNIYMKKKKKAHKPTEDNMEVAAELNKTEKRTAKAIQKAP